ncbi:MAG: rane protein [Microbacteriaceae bacterium]|nr:rane protein [Microbacteriaceae bacterium]
MAVRPKISDIPRIRAALKFYRVFAYITGSFLLLLCLEMILKYTGIHREIYLLSPAGFLALVPWNPVDPQKLSGVNLSTGILIAHGWLYVVYLFSDFRLWSLMRWPFSRFIQIALGGVVPFLSFIVEGFITRRTNRELVALEAPVPVEVTN